MRNILYPLASIFLLVSPAVAREKMVKIKFDGGADQVLAEGIRQSLSQVKGVQIVSENPDFVVKLLVVQGKDLCENSPGYVASMVITKTIGSFDRSQLIQALQTPSSQRFYEEELLNYERFLSHMVFREPNLESLVGRVVTNLPK